MGMRGRVNNPNRAGSSTATGDARWQMDFSRPAEDTLLIRLSGDWKLENGLPSATEVIPQFESSQAIRRLVFDTQGLTGWDSGLVNFLLNLLRDCKSRDFEVLSGRGR